MAICKKCGANPVKDNVYLKRVNKLGVDGIWECKPNCQTKVTNDNLVSLILDETEENMNKGVKNVPM